MINFFKGIFNKSSFPARGQHEYELFFDVQKHQGVIVTILPDQTVQDIYNLNHNTMIDQILNCHSMQTINSSEFSFVVLNSNYPFTWIKLKETDMPLKYLKSNIHSLHYLNCTTVKNELVARNREQIQPKSKIILERETIREGELFKYSFTASKFDKRYIILDKEKLVLKKLKENEIHVLLFSDVLFITTEIQDKRILQQANSKYVFEIRTKDSERYFFSSKSSGDLEAWIDAITVAFTISKDNDKIREIHNSVGTCSNDIYSKEIKVMNCLFNLTGVFAVEEIRRCFLAYSEVHLRSIEDQRKDSLLEKIVSNEVRDQPSSAENESKNGSKASLLSSHEQISALNFLKEMEQETSSYLEEKMSEFNEKPSLSKLNSFSYQHQDIGIGDDQDDLEKRIKPSFNNKKSSLISASKSMVGTIKPSRKDIYCLIQLIQAYKLKSNLLHSKRQEISDKCASNINELLTIFESIFNEAEYSSVHKYYEEYLNNKPSSKNLYSTKGSVVEEEYYSISGLKLDKEESGSELNSNSEFSSKEVIMPPKVKSIESNLGKGLEKSLSFNVDNKRYVKLSNSHYKHISNAFSLLEGYKLNYNSKLNKILSVLKPDLFDELYYRSLVSYFSSTFYQFSKDIMMLFNYNIKKRNAPAKYSHILKPLSSCTAEIFKHELEVIIEKLLVSYYKKGLAIKWILQLDSLYGLKKQNLN